MTRSNWTAQERPFLEALRDGTVRDDAPTLEAWFEGHGLERDEGIEMLNDLATEGYIHFAHQGSWGRPMTRVLELKMAPRGRRLLGLWPTDDTQAQVLLDVLLEEVERRVASSSDSEERSRLQRFAEAAREFGTGVLAEVTATAIMRASGMA